MTVIENQALDISSLMMRNAEPDWEQRRYEIALAVYMERRKLLTSREDDVKDAVAEADLLIAELKKPQEKK